MSKFAECDNLVQDLTPADESTIAGGWGNRYGYDKKPYGYGKKPYGYRKRRGHGKKRHRKYAYKCKCYC